MSKSQMRLSDEILHCKRVRKRVGSGTAAFGRASGNSRHSSLPFFPKRREFWE
jgi:hypothetical protein